MLSYELVYLLMVPSQRRKYKEIQEIVEGFRAIVLRLRRAVDATIRQLRIRYV